MLSMYRTDMVQQTFFMKEAVCKTGRSKWFRNLISPKFCNHSESMADWMAKEHNTEKLKYHPTEL